MTDLRAACIEAGARDLAIRFDKGAQYAVEWQDEATQCLDSFLDTLADRADEWYEAASPEWDNGPAYAAMKRVVVKKTLNPLIAVLRGDTEE